RVQQVFANEQVVRVEDVRADGAHRERAVAHRLELLPLPEIERQRDDLAGVRRGEALDGIGGGRAAGVGENDAGHSLVKSFSFLTRAPAPRAPRPTTRI